MKTKLSLGAAVVLFASTAAFAGGGGFQNTYHQEPPKVFLGCPSGFSVGTISGQPPQNGSYTCVMHNSLPMPCAPAAKVPPANVQATPYTLQVGGSAVFGYACNYHPLD